MQKQLSIEVYRDVDTPEVDPAIGVAGIDIVNAVTNNSLRLVASSRKIRIAQADSPLIDASKVRWGSSPLDMRLVLTNRSLRVNGRERAIGFSDLNPEHSGGTAVVSTSGIGAAGPESTVAHELGHLFNMQYKTEDSHHCNSDTCIMHSELKRQIEDMRVPRRGIQRWLERSGRIMPEYQTVETNLNTQFCEPCEHQLARRAFFMIKYLQGQYVPSEWR